MRAIVIACVLLLAPAAGNSAFAWPKEVDCPAVHPEDASLQFINMTLDQNQPGIAWPPDSDRDISLDQGLIQTTTFYAAYQILRDQVMICEYSETRQDAPISIYRLTKLPIFLPGILMRCEGILREAPGTQPIDWKRRWCVHDPDG